MNKINKDLQFKSELWGLLNIETGEYANGATAVYLTATHEGGGRYPSIPEGEIIAKISVNLEDPFSADLSKDHFWVNVWSENAGITQELRDSGLFVDTGRRAPAGYMVAELWKFANTEEPVYAQVRCHGECGKIVPLTYDQYLYQMYHPGRTWECPVCKGHATFDDEYFEKLHSSQQEEE